MIGLLFWRVLVLLVYADECLCCYFILRSAFVIVISSYVYPFYYNPLGLFCHMIGLFVCVCVCVSVCVCVCVCVVCIGSSATAPEEPASKKRKAPAGSLSPNKKWVREWVCERERQRQERETKATLWKQIKRDSISQHWKQISKVHSKPQFLSPRERERERERERP
jgi:hypothetical protein